MSPVTAEGWKTFALFLFVPLSLLQTRYKTNEPVWEETHTFLIHNPRTQQLEVEVLRRPVRSKKENNVASDDSLLGFTVDFR